MKTNSEKEPAQLSEGYLLRYLAGRYFLIRTDQKYPDYRKPVEMDETGAEFWKLLCRYPGEPVRAAEHLARKYHISPAEAAADLEDFKIHMKELTEV